MLFLGAGAGGGRKYSATVDALSVVRRDLRQTLSEARAESGLSSLRVVLRIQGAQRRSNSTARRFFYGSGFDPKISFGLTFTDEGGFRVATILQSALDETMRPMNEIARIFLSSNPFQNPGNSNIGTGH